MWLRSRPPLDKPLQVEHSSGAQRLLATLLVAHPCHPPPPSLRPADHRSKVNYDLNKVLEGGLEESIQEMIGLDQRAQLQDLMEAV